MLWWDDDETAAWAGEVVGLVDDDRFDEAAKMATAMLPERKSDIDKAVLYAVRGIARAGLGEHDSAIADFTRVLEVECAGERGMAKDRDTYNERGLAYYEKGEHDLAIADFTRAIEFGDPSFAEPYHNRASVRVDRDEYELALADLNKALKIDGEDDMALALRGAVYRKLNQHEKAEADFEKAAQLEADEGGEDDEGDDVLANNLLRLHSASDWQGIVTLVTDALPDIEDEFEKAMFHRARGNAHLSLENTQSAIADFTRALELDPGNGASDYKPRGMAYLKQGDYDAAIADASRAEVADDMGATYIRGVACHEKGEHDRAIADLTRCIENENEPPIAEAHFHRGVSYLYKEDFARGFADLDKAIELKPDNTVMYLMRAAAYEERGEFQKAVADYKNVLRLDPRNEDAREGLHSMLENAQKRGMKIITPDGEPFDLSIIKDAEAMGPTDDGGESFAQELRQLQDEGEWDEVVKMASAALPVTKSKHSLSVLHYYRGDALAKKGEVESAIADLTLALELGPENSADVFASRGLAYFTQGDYDSAIADLSREEIADDIGAVYLRGCAYHETEQHDLAIADFNKVIETESDFPGAHYHRGAAYTEKGGYARAVADLSKEIELSPDNAMAYILRGYALSMQGKHRIGLADLNQALRLDPDNTEAREVRRLIRQRAKGRI